MPTEKEAAAWFSPSARTPDRSGCAVPHAEVHVRWREDPTSRPEPVILTAAAESARRIDAKGYGDMTHEFKQRLGGVEFGSAEEMRKKAESAASDESDAPRSPL
ncbi:MAG: hypothetical protein ACHREM_19150 [Polyangiales bacterium]